MFGLSSFLSENLFILQTSPSFPKSHTVTVRTTSFTCDLGPLATGWLSSGHQMQAGPVSFLLKKSETKKLYSQFSLFFWTE